MKISIIAVAGLLATSLFAQNFDSVSVKPAAAGGSANAQPATDPAHVSYSGVTLKSVIAQAYSVPPDRITGPRWLGDDRFDISATLPAGASQSDIPLMLQHLLADHFGLVIHEQTKSLTGYALLAGKGPLNINRSVEGRVATIDMASDHMQLNNYTMPDFAKFLATSIGRPVVDETGLNGRYDIALYSSMSEIQSALIGRAIQQLGLRIETRSIPAKFIVVDKADRTPSGI
jgi:uncharacterized protein (TIGR03435 family)